MSRPGIIALKCIRNNAIKSLTTSVVQEPAFNMIRSVSRINLNAYLNQAPQFSIGTVACRYFSSRPYPKNSRNNKNNGNKFRTKGRDRDGLMNEHLIRQLLRKSGKDAKSTQIRLVIDREAETKPDIQIMSLFEAIKTSGELGVDLVGINLQQEYPIVKAIDYNKLQYDESKKKSGKNTGGKVGGTHVTKEFQFRAGIEDNDLNRKVQNMISYLIKGHPCQVAITSNRRNLRHDSNAVVTTLGRVSELIGENGKQQGRMKKNVYGNRGSLLFQPNSKKTG